MSPEAETYVQVVEELKRESQRARVLELTARADAIWWQLSEAEQDEIERRLVAIDDAEAQKEIT